MYYWVYVNQYTRTLACAAVRVDAPHVDLTRAQSYTSGYKREYKRAYRRVSKRTQAIEITHATYNCTSHNCIQAVRPHSQRYARVHIWTWYPRVLAQLERSKATRIQTVAYACTPVRMRKYYNFQYIGTQSESTYTYITERTRMQLYALVQLSCDYTNTYARQRTRSHTFARVQIHTPTYIQIRTRT